MKDFEAIVIFSGGEIVTIKSYGYTIYDVVDNLIQMNEIINIIKITSLSDERQWIFKKNEREFLALRKARKYIMNEVLLKNVLRVYSESDR